MMNRISRIGISSISYKKSNTWVDNEEVEVEEGSVKRIILREWQKECKKGFVEEFIEGDKKGGIINATTGAGKTITSLMLLNNVLKHNKNTKIIISIPQREIHYGFCKKYIIDGEEIEVSNKGIKDDKKTESILNFLKFPSNHPGKRALICTHQALIAAFKRASHNRKYFKNVLIIIDEAHHIDGSETSNELGKIEKYIFSHSEDKIKLLLMTATLFRGDRNNVVSDIENYHIFKLPLDRHFEDNCNHLKKIKYDFVVTDNHWENSIPSQIKKGDKTVLFIPHTASKYLSHDKMAYINKIMKSLADNGKVSNKGEYYSITRSGKEFKIVDLVDDSVDRKVKDKYISENPNDIDMILAMCKFKEGSDWPLANNIIIVGIRNSLTDLVQMSGRGFRDHITKNNKAVRITQVIPDIVRSNMKEDVSGKVNEFFQCLFSAFIFEEILSPKKLKLEKEERLERVEQESDGSYNYHELFDTENDMLGFEETVIEQLDNFKFNNEDLSKKQLMDGYYSIVKDLVREEMGIENESNIEVIAKDIITKYKKRTANLVKEINLPSNDIDIDFNMIREEVEKDDVLGYQLLLSTGIWGISDSKKLREVIGLSLEAASNAMCKELCLWLKKNNKKSPINGSKDPIEAKFGVWLSDRKQAKKGKGGCIFYESDLKIANKMGYPNLFEEKNKEEESNQKCINLCLWLKKNNKENPSQKSKDSIEAKFAEWLNSRKQAKKGKGKGNRTVFYESDLKIAKKMGFPNLFEEKNKEEESNQKCINLCLWLKKNNKENPSQKSKDSIEAKFAEWLNSRKQAKKGKGYIFYESDLKIAKKMGFPNLFEEKNKEEESNQKCINLCLWLKKNNKKSPINMSKDPIEAKFGVWLSDRKQAKKGKGGCIFYESDLKIAKKMGFPNLFEEKNKEESNQTCINLCNWLKKNNKENPSQSSKDSIEAKFAEWLSHKRQAKKGKGGCIFYESDLKIANKMGYPNLFDTRN